MGVKIVGVEDMFKLWIEGVGEGQHKNVWTFSVICMGKTFPLSISAELKRNIARQGN